MGEIPGPIKQTFTRIDIPVSYFRVGDQMVMVAAWSPDVEDHRPVDLNLAYTIRGRFIVTDDQKNQEIDRLTAALRAEGETREKIQDELVSLHATVRQWKKDIAQTNATILRYKAGLLDVGRYCGNHINSQIVTERIYEDRLRWIGRTVSDVLGIEFEEKT